MYYESHNSFTYLSPRQWWLKPFAIFAKCQSLDFKQQYAAGVRCYDVRIRFDDFWRPIVCHGIVEYQFPKGENINTALAWLADVSAKDVQIAFRLEERRDDGTDFQEQRMVEFVKRVIAKHGDRLLFDKVYRQRDMTMIYDPQSATLPYKTFIDFGSYTYECKPSWYGQCLPILYALINNRNPIDESVYQMRMMDFVK